MLKNSISHSRLLELLDYDPLTGLFTWKESRGNIAVGSIAGHLGNMGYIRIRVDKDEYAASILAWFYMTGSWPKLQIDHDDRDKTNNSWNNLFEVESHQNQKNMKLFATNNSGVAGVGWQKRDKRWRARLEYRGKVVYSKSFKSFHKAVAVRKALEVFYGYHPNHGT